MAIAGPLSMKPLRVEEPVIASAATHAATITPTRPAPRKAERRCVCENGVKRGDAGFIISHLAMSSWSTFAISRSTS